MSRDFFLLNRSHQLNRLCGMENPTGFRVPAAKARHRLPPRLQEFYTLLDRICVAAGRTANQDPLDTSHTQASPEQLSREHRQDLEEFERVVVRNRFSEDANIKQPAVQCIRAIFADAEYFSGLKPLPQYTEAFAYELLFPSWLNLLKASMLPRTDNAKPRLDGQQQGALFEFLGKLGDLADADHLKLVGYLTFIASRFDAPDCEELIQRLVDLFSRFTGRILTSLDGIDLHSKDARDFKQRLQIYLRVKYSTAKLAGTADYPIARDRPTRRSLPDVLVEHLNAAEETQNWDQFFALALPLSKIIQSPHTISGDLIGLLRQHTSHIAWLLSLVAGSDSCVDRVLAPEAQDCLARMITQAPELITQSDGLLTAFANKIASRMGGYQDHVHRYFQRILIDDEEGRKLLLAGCERDELRQQLEKQLLLRAGKADDNKRFLTLLCCATIVSPNAANQPAKIALQAIDAVIGNRTIGNKEISDLVDDLQANVQQALEYLAVPIMAAAGKSPRLASLYLTLNEVSEKLANTGGVENFSVLRAKYSAITNMDV